MRHKIIVKVKSRLYKKRQLVILEFENSEFIFISHQEIYQNTKLGICEIELLIGSRVRFEFYRIGEKMFNGKVCNKNNILVKSYFIELSASIENLRFEKKEFLLPYKRIDKIFYYEKFNRQNVGIEDEDKNVIFLSLSRFEMFCKLKKDEQHILVGSYICPVYYPVGHILKSGEKVLKQNMILEQLNLRYSDKIEQMHESFENNISYYSNENYNYEENNIQSFSDWLSEEFGDDAGVAYWNLD